MKFLNILIFSIISIISHTASHAQQPPREVRVVVVEGIGRDTAEATQNAAQNALTNVIGSFIDANTLLSKRTVIQDGIKQETKNITKDIVEYSQGSIHKFEIVNANNEGLVRITARVSVRVEDFKAYVTKLASLDNRVSESVFATVSSQARQDDNLAKILHSRVLSPAVKGSVIEIKSTDLTNINDARFNEGGRGVVNVYRNANSDKTILAIKIKAQLREDFYTNLQKTLEAIAVGKTIQEEQNPPNQSVTRVAAMHGNYVYGAGKTNPGGWVFWLQDTANSWQGFEIKKPDLGSIRSTSSDEWWLKVFGGRTPYPTGTNIPSLGIKIDLVDDQKNIVSRHFISSNDPKPFPIDKQSALVPNAHDAIFTNNTFGTAWSMIGVDVCSGGSPQCRNGLFIQREREFTVVIAVDRSRLAAAKSFSVSFVN